MNIDTVLGWTNLFSLSSNWNIILLIIFLCSIVGVTIFIERLLFLKRSETDTNQFIIQLRTRVKNRDMVDAINLCEEEGGPIANIVKHGLYKASRSQEEIEHAMEMMGLMEIAKLEKNAKVLSVLAHVAPLIGLLGTVLGFIQAFAEMRMSGLVDISATRIGEAMEYALITTAAGLVVAIPCVIAYNYIVSRIENFVLEIRTTSSEVVDLLVHQEEEF